MTRFTSALLALALVAVPAHALSLEELLHEVYAARGGLEKIKAVDSMVMSGTLLMQGNETPFSVKLKRPNMMRLEIQMGEDAMIQCYDGESGWMVAPLMGMPDPVALPPDQLGQLEEQADLDGELVDYEAKGHTVELLDDGELDGKPVHRIKLVRHNGTERTFYIDPESFLELRMDTHREMEGNEVSFVTSLSDFQTVDGLVIPFTYETTAGDQVVSRVKVEEIDLEAGLDDALFKMPAAKEVQP